MLTPTVQITIICIITVFTIAAYGTFRCKSSNFKDPLTASIASPPWDKFLDGWGIIHLVFYGVLTYIYPSKWMLIFAFGVLWEIIESLFHEHPFYISKCNYVLDTDQVAGWWYGRWQDIIMNSIGMSIGYMLYKIQ